MSLFHWYAGAAYPLPVPTWARKPYHRRKRLDRKWGKRGGKHGRRDAMRGMCRILTDYRWFQKAH